MNDLERDREVAAAWRAASRAEPPASLDAAIVAQARRAVAAGPERARRHRQWRYPAAAAATVAALAFGIAQMTSRENVEPVVVADQAAARGEAAAPAPAAAAAVQPSEPAPASKPAAEPKPAAPSPPAARLAPPPARGHAPKEKSPPGDRFAAAPPPAPANGMLAKTAPRQGDVPAMPEGAARREALAAPSPPSAAASTGARTALSALPAGGTSPPSPASLDEAKAKQAGVDSVAAWIARIRDLRDKEQLTAAARELAAFRAAYGDRADALLPRDLRGLAATDGTPR
ncbi:MAG TPA: hypothetical protein VMN79_16650 [Casimicrobiaceae bacterium]|nr:hypothetical protein [Casimicrobiaceae bacterium]